MRKKEIYEALYPETKQNAVFRGNQHIRPNVTVPTDQKRGHGTKFRNHKTIKRKNLPFDFTENDVADTDAATSKKSFVDDSAEKMGVSCGCHLVYQIATTKLPQKVQQSDSKSTAKVQQKTAQK